jgi:hypothetical protein
MRAHWVVVVLIVGLVAASAAPASACIPGMPEQEFEAQAVAAGTAFLEPTHLSRSTVDELFPQTISFKDRLYVTWQREDFNDTVKYFVTLTSFDGTEWSSPLYISSPDMDQMVRSELNLNPRFGASEEVLYLAWASNEPNWTNGNDDDIVFRYTEDGETWSEVIQVTGHYNDGLDKLPRVQPFKGTTWFLWETNDRYDSDGTDMDIVMRPWDGNDFGQTVEVTPSGDVYNDHHVQVAADDDHMYFMWMKKNYTSGYANVHDVWGRVFDGTQWVTPPMKINSDAIADNEHPHVVAADGQAFFVWETQDTGKLSDPTSIVMRQWDPEDGLGRRVIISSMTSNGKDSGPVGLWHNSRLYVTWISIDQGVTFGSDADLICRIGELDDEGQVRFDDFNEISSSTDDYEDRQPQMVVYDDIVNVVWAIDTNYTDIIPPDILVKTGGTYRSPDVAIQSIEIPFEKQLGLVYTLGTAFPTAGKPTTAKVTVADLLEEPMEDLQVSLLVQVTGNPDWKTRLRPLEDKGNGVYARTELEFPQAGNYQVTIVVEGVEAGAFTVDVVPPPPSYIDRVPLTAVFFAIAGVAVGLLLYRAMGRDEMVDEIRPAPLGLVVEESY